LISKTKKTKLSENKKQHNKVTKGITKLSELTDDNEEGGFFKSF
jgi:hypothetical protein